MEEVTAYAWVEATDGQEKRAMWGGTNYVLPAGERKLFPLHLADKFVKDNRLAPRDGYAPEPTVTMTIHDGPVTLASEGLSAVTDPETGAPLSTSEIMARLKAAVTGKKPPKEEAARA